MREWRQGTRSTHFLGCGGAAVRSLSSSSTISAGTPGLMGRHGMCSAAWVPALHMCAVLPLTPWPTPALPAPVTVPSSR